MVVGAKALDASLGEVATGADLGGSSKYSNPDLHLTWFNLLHFQILKY